jgi:DeoR/GlpR family transcriptional regulator of sugar metabolism
MVGVEPGGAVWPVSGQRLGAWLGAVEWKVRGAAGKHMNSSGQRREKILAAIYEKRHVTARDLALELPASEATVRRDLKVLAEAGEIELVYGGATLRRSSDYSFHSKGKRNVEAKRVIGRLAADLVGEDEQIYLDSGTTCFELLPFLKSRRRLSIICSSARLALEVNTPGISVILLGGQYRPARMDTVGLLATATLDQLRGYLCFIGADGLDRDFGPAAADLESADLNRRAVRNARQTVLLVDHTKFAAASLCKVVDWELVARIVTDRAPTPEWMDFLSSRGIQVDYPEE